MRFATIVLLILSSIFTSCTSEYEERLKEGRKLAKRLETVEQNNVLSNESLLIEIMEIRKEIIVLSKISGNEELFLKEISEN